MTKMLINQTKTAPLGICDFCAEAITDPYTRRGTPRLFCSRECMNTANSRKGAPERSRQLKERVARGEWSNPSKINPPNPANLAAASRAARLREMAEGRWQNPAQTPQGRAKLSKPHKHSGVLADAIKKIGPGVGMADLTPEEADAYRAYKREGRREREAAWSEERRAEKRLRQRDDARRRSAALNDEERAELRQKWRESKRRQRTQA